jgi:N-acetyl-anhydromuramyl-L-alanine amidase AmpD
VVTILLRRLTSKVALRAAIAMTPAAVAGDVKIIDMRGTLPTRPGVTYATRSEAQITGIVWHHTAGNREQPLRDIADYHVRVRKWPGIGYHYAIDQEGKVFQMQAVTTVSYHAYMNNTPNIGVVLVGNYEEERPSPAMKAAAKALTRYLKARYPIRQVRMHSETKATLCPGKHAKAMLRDGR